MTIIYTVQAAEHSLAPVAPENSHFSRRAFLTIAAATAAGCSQTKDVLKAPQSTANPTKSVEQMEEERLKLMRDAMVSYLTDPRFGGGKDFLQKMGISDIDLEMYYSDIRLLCFSMNEADFKGVEESFAQLLVHPKDAHFGYAEVNGTKRFVNADRSQKIRLTVDGRSFAFNRRGKYVFAADLDNFRVDPDKPLVYRRGNTTYDPTPAELTDFILNESIYGGYSYIIDQVGDEKLLTVNFGTQVAKPGEPSLSRLVQRLIDEGDTDEAKAQKILSFVTKALKYSDKDVDFEKKTNMELVKRPNEVLMTGEGDCASKALLLASLFEQAGIDYRLIYMLPSRTRAGHLTNIVAGDFGNANGMECSIGEKTYSIAESTVPDFVIGRTRLQTPITTADMTYMQKPSDQTVIDVQTGKVIREKPSTQK